jgi:hypothetical protein
MKHFRDLKLIPNCVKCGQAPKVELGALLYYGSDGEELDKYVSYRLACPCNKPGVGISKDKQTAFNAAVDHWNLRNVP